MIQQLNPALPVDTPKGPAYAHLVIDYSQEHYLLFVCFLAETGECWVFPNRDVKLQKNMTMGVRTTPPVLHDHFEQPGPRWQTPNGTARNGT